MPFGKAQTMLVEQIRVFEDVVENVLQHESLVVPPAEEALVVLCHLVLFYTALKVPPDGIKSLMPSIPKSRNKGATLLRSCFSAFCL